MKRGPMGGGGIAVGIKDPRPMPIQTAAMKEAEAKQRQLESENKAAELINELATSPALKLIEQQMVNRLLELAQNDERFQGVAQIIVAIRNDIETTPRLATKLVHQIMGPKLRSIMKEAEVAR